MTAIEIVFRYGQAPGPSELRAIDKLRDVYGIRRIGFKQAEQTVRVEYDASRLSPETVAALLRRAGVDLKEQVALA